MTDLGVTDQRKEGPTNLLNVDVESGLIQQQITRPQRQKEFHSIDRFHYLPFDPQGVDYLKRGGVSTRRNEF